MADGIFCLETASWNQNSGLTKGRTSLEYFLRFLEVSSDGKIPHRHYDVATKAEIRFYLKEWNSGNNRSRYPVLLLAFHGMKNNSLVLPDEEDSELTIDDLVEYLRKKKDNDAIIHFAACHSSVKDDKMKNLLKETGALSVSGYDRAVGWYQSAAFELLFLAELFGFVSSETGKRGPPEGTNSMRKFAKENYAENQALLALGSEVEFQLWYDVRDASKANPKGLPEGIEPHRQKR